MRLYNLLFLVIVLGVFALNGTALACSNPTGQAGQIIYNEAHKTMQYCDATQWVGMGWKGFATQPLGKPGSLIYKRADGLAASSGLFWDTSNNFLGINTDTPKEALSIGNAMYIHTGGHIGLNFNTYGSDYYAGYNGGAKYAAKLLFSPINGRMFFALSPAAGTEGEIATFPIKLEFSHDGKLAVNKSSATATLDVNGPVRIAAGKSLIMDVIKADATLTNTTVSVTPSNGITCVHSAQNPPNFTTCTCPAGFTALSGGAFITAANGYLREIREISTVSWNIACRDHANNAISCNGANLTCARIVAN